MTNKTKPTLISRTVASVIINSSVDTFMGLDYVRKDGTRTTLNGRLRCKRDTVCKIKTKPASPYAELFTLFDVKRKGYRSISLDRIERVTVRGVTYTISN
jgi:hypothetical protein